MVGSLATVVGAVSTVEVATAEEDVDVGSGVTVR